MSSLAPCYYCKAPTLDEYYCHGCGQTVCHRCEPPNLSQWPPQGHTHPDQHVLTVRVTLGEFMDLRKVKKKTKKNPPLTAKSKVGDKNRLKKATSSKLRELGELLKPAPVKTRGSSQPSPRRADKGEPGSE